MSQWRAKGYVQDSDEEDYLDFDSEIDTQSPQRSRNDVPTYKTFGSPLTYTARLADSSQKVILSAANDARGQQDLASETPDYTKTTLKSYEIPPLPRTATSCRVDGIAKKSLLAPEATNSANSNPENSLRSVISSSQDSALLESPLSSSAPAEPADARFLVDRTENQRDGSILKATNSIGNEEQARPSTPITSKFQDDDIDELQTDWPLFSAANISGASSPLSEARSDIEEIRLPSSPPIVPTQGGMLPDIRLRSIQGVRQRLVQVAIPSRQQQTPRFAGEVVYEESSGVRGGRALRKRNPLQLHPYLLEGEKYRQMLKARGIRPVNVGTGHPRQHEEPQEMNSQDREFLADTQSSSVRHSSQPVDASSPPAAGISETSPEDMRAPAAEFDAFNIGSDDDFPDLSVILQSRPQGDVHKRRKTMQTFSSRKRSLRRTGSLPQSSRSSFDARNPFNVPPSPPPSRTPPLSTISMVKTRPFRFPPGIIPAQPPTPATSSSNRASRRRIIPSDSEDDSPPRSIMRPSRHLPPAAVDISDSSSADGGKMEKELRRAKKRIKGVLPASWLRLDQQAQARNKHQLSPERHRRTSSATSTIRPGTAELGELSDHDDPIPSVERTDIGNTVVVFDDSDQSEGYMPSTKAQRIHRPPISGVEEDLDNSMIMHDSFDIPEHDYVDPMLPSGHSRRLGTKAKRKKQLKLTEAIPPQRKRPRLDKSEGIGSIGLMSSTSSPRGKPDLGTGGRSKKAPRFKAPRLSILDAPSFNTSEPTQIPRFLKLAVRQVRQQPNEGRHRPSNKHIRLQTEADTEEANAPLHQWRAGKILPAAKHIGLIHARPLPSNRADKHQERRQQRLPSPEKIAVDSLRQTDPDPLSAAIARAQRGQTSTQQVKLKRAPLAQRAVSPMPPLRSKQLKIHVAPRRSGQKPNIKQPTYRTAQLESLEEDFDDHHRSATFRKKLSKMERLFIEEFRTTGRGNPHIAKFLEDEDEIAPLPLPSAVPLDEEQAKCPEVAPEVNEGTPPASVAKPRLPGRRVKPKARRFDVEAREYRQPSDPLPQSVENHVHIPIHREPAASPYLEGLSEFAARYTMDFDVFPLSLGTFFHESTILGSGELQHCLQLGDRDFDVPAGTYSFSYYGSHFRWSSWTEEVASGIGCLFSTIIARLENASCAFSTSTSNDGVSFADADGLNAMRAVTRYVSLNLHFLDPVDRRSFIVKLQSLLESVSTVLLPAVNDSSKTTFRSSAPQSHETRMLLMFAVLASQVLQVSNHPLVERPTQESMAALFKSLVRTLFRYVLRNGMRQLRVYLDDNRRHAQRELGIREDKCAIESIVVLSHLLETVKLSGGSFWEFVNEELNLPVAELSHVGSFETLFYDIFTLLPYLEFDMSGVLKVGRRLRNSIEDWSLVVSIMNRLAVLYPETSKRQPASINVYFRACLTRCHRLIQNWGWRKCESLITAIFDFFSRRQFAHLRNEDVRGSPQFLENLEQHPSLEIQPDDPAFHMFLKIMAIGFKGLRRLYPGKKIQNISWRLIPNHRRTYRKDETLRQEDLDALRNHHDLLSTMYWASPLGFRPRLSLLRNLVDHAQSHREVCRLSVRAWSNLARFQISTDEGREPLEAFAEWFSEIVAQNIAQYKLARSEAEAQFESMRFQGHEHVSSDHLQRTIKNNQAQILAILSDAVAGMKAAILVTNNLEYATVFLQKSTITEVFKLFDSKNSHASSLIVEVLEVLQKYLTLRDQKDCRLAERDQTNEDSQDYGSWDFDEEDIEAVAPEPAATYEPIGFLHEPIWHLLSSCFGADISPDDKLLTTVVDTWTQIAAQHVRTNGKAWGNYLDSYSTISWQQLRETEQTRKYGPYFIAAVVNRDSDGYSQHQPDILLTWMLSLVERESMLKFQHFLTTALLNRDPNHCLLKNLPFLRNRNGRTNITLTEFRERRLSLISTLLANMRDTYDEAIRTGHTDLPGLRREYTELLKHLMAAMKRHYLELQQGSTIKGAYVEFVQTVVEFLQQHTSDICAVDRFFTDSAAFPLPVTDPTYVVGRLKSYAPRLSETKTLKQLAVFLQTVSERAAVDNQQVYLVSQLRAATLGSFEHGDSRRPTLRQVLLQAIFPAYIELSFSSPAGWILSRPLLQASAEILDELDHQYSVLDEGSVAIAESILSTVLDVLLRTVELLITHSGLLDQVHVLHVLTWIFRTVTATIPSADYINRRTGRAVAAIQRIASFKAFSLFVASTLLQTNHFFSPYARNDPEPVDWPFVEIRQYCARALGQAMNNNWFRQEDDYFFVKGNSRREVTVHVTTLEEEKTAVIGAIEEFHTALRNYQEADRREEEFFDYEDMVL